MNRQDALDYHSSPRPGKIAVVPTKPLANQRDLSLAYSPGVAEPCLEIEKNPEDAYRYTARGNLVAVVTNGTAVLGLGNIGALAGKPVMEGKGNLFKQFADIDVFDLEVDSPKPEDVIRFCQLLEPSVGGINLEDIKAPDCFLIEETLRKTMKIPVFHDDQHGTAIISGAALINALEVVGKRMEDVRVVFSGAGASAIATAMHYERLGVRREHIVMCDRAGVIHAGREGHMDPYKARFATATAARTLAEALVDADVFVGLSAAGTVSREMVAAMARDPIVFALANPVPEILPEEVAAVRPDAIVATGRSDYPNQVNNVLGFPFIFRGALDARATEVNEEMKMAATRALAMLAREPVPESVARRYGLKRVKFGRDYLIPFPFDPRVLLWVAPAVAWAAVASGVAKEFIEVDAYREQLEARLGRARGVLRGIINRAMSDPKRVVLAEGEERRTIRAARILVDDGIAFPILLGNRERIVRKAASEHVSLDDIEIEDPAELSPRREAFARYLWERRQRKGMSLVEANRRLYNPNYYGCVMVATGVADAMLSGATTTYPETLRPALEVIGAHPKAGLVSGMYMLVFEKRIIFCADTTVNFEPTAEQLAQIGYAASRVVRTLGEVPRVAMLSFSNFGSVRGEEATRVAQAVQLLRQRDPRLTVDGEMQADTAVDAATLTESFPFSVLKEPANVLIFPNLSAGNIAYKLLHHLGGATAIGPILVGMARPVHVLEQGADVQDIVNMAAVAVMDAQDRSRPAADRVAPAPAGTGTVPAPTL
ncbi:MAG: NADP-dependent malic enzyme [Gemmatimonadaceae bacterium]|nr:NADP-dependent malic enzyme [Gemmatimonadaceae bacterium]